MEIRSARSEDVGSLVGLLEELFAIEEDFTFDIQRQTDGLHMLIDAPSAAVFVAVHNARVIGMISGQITISTAEGSYALMIEDLVVIKNMRRKGVGKALLHAVGDWGRERGADRMQLLADSSNRTALSFYERSGWWKTKLICLRSRQPSTSV